MLREINHDSSTTFIIVTHDRHIAAACDRVISIADGNIMEDLGIEPDSDHDRDKFVPCYCRMRNADR